MKILVVLLGLIVALFIGDVCSAVIEKEAIGKDAKIIGGQQAVAGQFPWQVAFIITLFSTRYFCGASLVSDQWILTLAKCANYGDNYTVILGALEYNDVDTPGRLELTPKRAIVHPDFNPITNVGDIALLELTDPIPLTDNIQPIPISNTYFEGNQLATISGWGRTSEGSQILSPTLKYIDVTTLSQDECIENFGNLSDHIVCAQTEDGGTGTCGGDQGSALVRKTADGYVQEAISMIMLVSACSSSKPSGYMRVAPYYDWISHYVPVL